MTNTSLDFPIPKTEKEAIALLKKIIKDYQGDDISIGEAVKKANYLFADYVSIQDNPNKHLLSSTLAMADLDTNLRINPIYAGESLQEAFEFANVNVISRD